MDKADQNRPVKKADEARIERLLRRMLEGMGAVVDRKLDHRVNDQSALSSNLLIQRMKRLIDDRIVDDPRRGRIAPHLLKLKIEWGTHSEAPPESLKELEHEILAAAIDHINDHRYRTLSQARVETIVDIFTTGIAIDPTFGEFEEELKIEEEKKRSILSENNRQMTAPREALPDIKIGARISGVDGLGEKLLALKPGGRRLSIGRAGDNDLCLNHPSVSKVHSAMVMNREGTLLLADMGSTNGTFINGRRIAYGESRQIVDGDVAAFGDVEVRFRKTES